MDEQENVAEKPKAEKPKRRQIVIETDGDSVHLVSADVAGKIELIAILDGLSGFIKASRQ